MTSTKTPAPWAHTPSTLTLLWLGISVPLVIWDTGYMMLRPHSMPGGAYHWPLWVPYELYGRIDYVYGWPSYESHNGFSGAQSFLNIIETLMYFWYGYIWMKQGKLVGQGVRKSLVGRDAGQAVTLLFAAMVMTASKTLLYWMCEWFSGYENIGHNTMRDIIVLWMIPNGPWLVFPVIIAYQLGNEILDAFDMASSRAQKKE